MKKTITILISVMLCLFTLMAYSATQTVNTVPSGNATFLTDLQTFLEDEDAIRNMLMFDGAVVTGGTAATDATLTHTISGVTAFVNGFYVVQASVSHTYTASKRTYVYLRDDDTRTVSIGAAVITYDSHFVFAEMATGTALPTTPTGCLPLFYADTGAAAITAVTDMRPLMDQTLWSNASTELTIASGEVFATQRTHSIDTESDAASDNLDTIITTIPDGGIIFIYPANDARTVVVRHNQGGVGEVYLFDDANVTLDDAADTLILQRRGNVWYEVMRLTNSTVTSHGVVELASAAETQPLADLAKVMTPDKLGASLAQHQETRSKFEYNDDDQIDVGAGVYGLRYTNDLTVVYWDSTLTTSALAGAVDTWYFLYIDGSAVNSLGSNELTSTELIWSTTAPTWTAAKKGWYNSDDRCIFAVRTDGSGDIIEFAHDGDLVALTSDIIVSDGPDNFDTTWVAVDMSDEAPSFCTKALVTAVTNYVDGTSFCSWRPDDTVGGGHYCSYADANNTRIVNTVVMIMNGSQSIDFKHSASNANYTTVRFNGWFLPIGM